jgi:serine/threonine protein kinase
MTNQQQLNGLLNRMEEMREQGQDVSAEEICRDAPHLLDEFRAMAAELQRVDRFMADGPADDGRQELMAAGRYRPLYLHAHGGLGEVFAAQDDELRRRVALKRIRARDTTDADRRRFQLEAEITGRLDHPGVVPVYGLGQDSAGRLYYAMRFIGGESLQQAIERFHHSYPSHRDTGPSATAFNKLIRKFVVVCQTIAYAHSQEIIHRDLKPANIMLGPYGETVVIDWGLAKRIERQATPDGETIVFTPGTATTVGGATILGEIKGSPAYMSPEQAEGHTDKIGACSDIYSLGATLYTILTGHKPIEGNDPRMLLERVKRGDFPRPRQLRGDVPRPLEAICLKAMARDPADRYATASDLAADLELWLDGNPIAAWREPWLDRARRWMRKHRTLTSSVAASVLVALLAVSAVVVMLGAFTVRLDAEKHELEESNAALNTAKENLKATNDNLASANDSLQQKNRQLKTARDEAQKNLERCADQLGEMSVTLFEDPSVIVYLGHPLHAKIADALFHQIDRFADEMPDDEAGERFRIWRESMRLVRIQSDPRPGFPDDLRKSLVKARSILETAFQKHHDQDHIAVEIALAYGIESLRLAQAGDGRGARAAIEKGLTWCEKYGRPGTRYGKFLAYEASILVAATAEPTSKDTTRDWEQILKFADRALALMKNNESPPDFDALGSALWALGWRSDLNGAASTANTERENRKTMENYRDCYGPAMVLAIKANYLCLLHRYDEALAPAKLSLEYSGRCTKALANNRYILLVKAQAELIVGRIECLHDNFRNGWESFCQALAHAKQSQDSPGPTDPDQGFLNLFQVPVAHAGVEYLRSPAATQLLTAQQRRAIRETSLLAIKDYLATPATGQDNQERAEMESCRKELLLLSTDPGNGSAPAVPPTFPSF